MATVGSHGKPEQRTFIDGTVKYADEQGDHHDDDEEEDEDHDHDHNGDDDDDVRHFMICFITLKWHHQICR